MSFFHLGLNVETAQQIEFLCKGDDFLSKTAGECWEFLEELADKHRGWETNDNDRSTPFSSGQGIVGVTIRDQQLQNQVEKLTKKVEELSASNTRSVNEVKVEEVCDWCERRGHVVTACPGYVAAKEASQVSICEDVNAVQGWNPYSNTYNSGWANHPNLRWRDDQQSGGGQVQPNAPPLPPPQQQQNQYRPPQNQLAPYQYQPRGVGQYNRGPPGFNNSTQAIQSLEETVRNLASDTKETVRSLATETKELRAQFSQFMAFQNQVQQEKGKFPTQGTTSKAHFVGSSQYSDTQHPSPIEMKVVTTKRGAPVVDTQRLDKQELAPPVVPAKVPSVNPITVEGDLEGSVLEVKRAELVKPVQECPRLSQRDSGIQFLELIKKLRLPILLLEALDTIPECAETLVAMCAEVRRKGAELSVGKENESDELSGVVEKVPKAVAKEENPIAAKEQTLADESKNPVVESKIPVRKEESPIFEEESFMDPKVQEKPIDEIEIPEKRRDPGSPTITIEIGDHQFTNALLDLGASINALPYSTFCELGVGELRTTPVTLQLADHSVLVPKGMVEDVLVRIGEFQYRVDFIVVDTCVSSGPSQIILGRPFLATSKALVDCDTGRVQLSAGTKKLEVGFHGNKTLKETEVKVPKPNLFGTPGFHGKGPPGFSDFPDFSNSSEFDGNPDIDDLLKLLIERSGFEWDPDPPDPLFHKF